MTGILHVVPFFGAGDQGGVNVIFVWSDILAWGFLSTVPSNAAPAPADTVLVTDPSAILAPAEDLVGTCVSLVMGDELGSEPPFVGESIVPFPLLDKTVLRKIRPVIDTAKETDPPEEGTSPCLLGGIWMVRFLVEQHHLLVRW